MPRSKRHSQKEIADLHSNQAIPDDILEALRHHARAKTVGRKRIIFRKTSASTEVGVPVGFERKTLVLSTENVERIERFNAFHGLKVREGVNRILDTYFQNNPAPILDRAKKRKPK